MESNRGNTSFYLKDSFRRDMINPSTLISSTSYDSEFQSFRIIVLNSCLLLSKRRGQIPSNTAVGVLLHYSDPMENDANKLFIVDSSETVFQCVIRTTVGSPPVHI